MEKFELTQETKAKMKQIIETALLQLGIKTSIEFTTTLGDDTFKSTDILCQPMVFKRLYVQGNVWVIKQSDCVYQLSLVLTYKFETFQGGFNGSELGSMTFMVYLLDKEKNYQKLQYNGMVLSYLGQ